MSLLQKNMQKDVRIAVNAINAVKKLSPLKTANLRFTAKNSPLMLRNVFASKKLAKTDISQILHIFIAQFSKTSSP